MKEKHYFHGVFFLSKLAIKISSCCLNVQCSHYVSAGDRVQTVIILGHVDAT